MERLFSISHSLIVSRKLCAQWRSGKRLLGVREVGWVHQRWHCWWLLNTGKTRVCLIAQNDFLHIVNLDIGHRHQGGGG